MQLNWILWQKIVIRVYFLKVTKIYQECTEWKCLYLYSYFIADCSWRLDMACHPDVCIMAATLFKPQSLCHGLNITSPPVGQFWHLYFHPSVCTWHTRKLDACSQCNIIFSVGTNPVFFLQILLGIQTVSVTKLAALYAGLILGLHPANERCHYKVMASLIGWPQT